MLEDALAVAAHTTLSAGSARLRRVRLNPDGEVDHAQEGIADFARRRTQVEGTLGRAMEEAAERFGEQVEARWPWLAGDDEDELEPRLQVFAGTAEYQGREDDWVAIRDGDPAADRRMHSDPTWLLEALSRAHVTSTASDETETVRGELCRRWSFELDLARRHGALEVPPHRGRTPPRYTGDAWIDQDGRLRRVHAHATTYVQRARSQAAQRRPGGMTLELWDFGIAAEIGVPAIPRRVPGAGLADIVRVGWELRRRRRAYND